MIPDALGIYPSLEEFYNANEARLRSPEIDFGVMWRDSHFFPTWRVSYVDLTGEIYAVKMGGATNGSVEIIGRLPLRPCEACNGTGGETTSCPKCSGTSFSRQPVEAALASWADVCGDERSLEWARQRAAGERVPVPGAAVQAESEPVA